MGIQNTKRTYGQKHVIWHLFTLAIIVNKQTKDLKRPVFLLSAAPVLSYHLINVTWIQPSNAYQTERIDPIKCRNATGSSRIKNPLKLTYNNNKKKTS